jgi:hypothetical protein
MGILVGLVLAYDKGVGRATVGMRTPVRWGDRLQIVGGSTDVEFKLKAPSIRTRPTGGAGAWQYEMDIFSPPVAAGDMVFRVFREEPAFTPTVA